MPFDKDSGLVFKEDIIRLPRCQHDVEHNSRYVKQRQQSTLEYGTSSLSTTAVNTLLNNMSNLEAEALRPLPKHIIEKLWSAVTRAGADSLHAWQVFAKTGHLGCKSVKTFRISCNQCSRRLLGLAEKIPLRSQVSWLTTLTICESAYDISQIMGLTKLDSLQNLHIRSNRPPSQSQETIFSDRLLRALGIEARHHGALPRLQRLFVDNQRDVTLNSLQYLNDFPALSLFCAHDCSFPKHETLKSYMQGTGWHLDQGHDVAESLYHYMTLKHVNNSTMFPWPTSVRRFLQYQHGRMPQNDRPMLDIEVVPQCLSMSYRSPISLAFNAFLYRVVCFLRDEDRAITAQTLPAPEPPAKRRKLGNKKSRAFDDLLHGLT
ncbi:hypothetical protein HII31_02566 [Pseudocercospora fuligena]|uniref:Uncharacterized protein n=1 Tax=Pseudocercospora fuligena TaxID=685502 RepID=A0A8H6VLI5_9PEZI|nr:hypothetical protein HII31_02566 [Pseudocercospora fuligena]